MGSLGAAPQTGEFNPDEFEPAPFHLYDTQVARVKAETVSYTHLTLPTKRIV